MDGIVFLRFGHYIANDNWYLPADNMNGIWLYRSEELDTGLPSIYYGDEINLKFWKALNMEFGHEDGSPYLQRQDGYVYRYYYYSKEFKCYDNNNVLFYQRSNVRTIADLHIAFNIHKSHQFEIILLREDALRYFFLAAMYVPVE